MQNKKQSWNMVRDPNQLNNNKNNDDVNHINRKESNKRYGVPIS